MPSKDVEIRVSSRNSFSTFSNGCGDEQERSTGSTDGSFNFKPKLKTWSHTPNFTALRRSHAVLPDNSFDLDLLEMDLKSRLVLEVTNPYKPEVPEDGQVCQPEFRYTRERLAAYLPKNPGDNSPSFTDLKYRVISKAKSNQFNLPIFLAEGRKTVDMVVGTSRKLANMLFQLRRGNIKFFLEALHVSAPLSRSQKARAIGKFNSNFGKDARKTASNTWLEYTYGWTPFMKDVHDAVMTVADLAEKPDRRVMNVKASSTRLTRFNESGVILEVSPFDIYCKRTRLIRESRRISWKCGVNPVDIPARLGLINPLEVAWELVPFSFVADWFLPIGNYLSALDVPIRFMHLGGTTGFRRVTIDTCYAPETNPSFNPLTGGRTIVKGSFSNSYVMIRRSPLTSPPIPSASELVVSADLGVKRLISSVALLSQQVSRLR